MRDYTLRIYALCKPGQIALDVTTQHFKAEHNVEARKKFDYTCGAVRRGSASRVVITCDYPPLVVFDTDLL